MPTPLERRECAQTLRRLARKAGVDPVSDSSGKDKVRCMALAVLGALDDASEDLMSCLRPACRMSHKTHASQLTLELETDWPVSF